MLGGSFAALAGRLSQAMGGPYHAAIVHTSTAPVTDDGGSIVTPGQPIQRPCMCQVDTATDAMRQDVGFVQGDARLLVLGVAGTIGTDAEVEVSDGPGAGRYSIQAVTRDTAGFGWDCRGRRV